MGWGNCFCISQKPGCSIKKLLKAAVNTATEKNKEPPPLLKLYWQCRKWGALPKAGGINDQDYRTMYLMNILALSYDAAEAWHKAPKDMTPTQKDTFLWLNEVGVK